MTALQSIDGWRAPLDVLKRSYWQLRAEHDRRKLYKDWLQANCTLRMSDKAAIERHIAEMASHPLISVVMPTYNTPARWLRRAIESVRNQLYPHWELCIADDASTTPHVRRILERYARIDTRIKVTFRDRNGHISAASNSALELVAGEFIALLDHDDELARHALYMVAAELERHPDAELLYSDEDKMDAWGRRFEPHFKSDWNPELVLAQNYFCHLGVYKTEVVGRAGGFREGFEGSQDYDLLLRCSALTDATRIRHIPQVLYHWRAIEGSTSMGSTSKQYAEQAGVRSLQEHLGDRAIAEPKAQLPTNYRVRYRLPSVVPLVSVILVSGNKADLLLKCLDSLRLHTRYPRYEIIVVDTAGEDRETLACLESLKTSGGVRILACPHAGNLSATNNFAVQHSSGDVICFLSNRLTVISPDWLDEMVSHALRAGVGAVGARLLYPDGRLQHGGMILGIGGVAGYSHKFLQPGGRGYFNRIEHPQTLSAVSAACLAVRKSVFSQVGGFDEIMLPIAFNDIDLCLRIRDAGYRNVWTPYATLRHPEPTTRGDDTRESPEHVDPARTAMRERWGAKLLEDPFYNPNLTLAREDFSLAALSRIRKPWAERMSVEKSGPR